MFMFKGHVYGSLEELMLQVKFYNWANKRWWVQGIHPDSDIPF